MPGDHETAMAKAVHQTNHVIRHGAFRIARVIRTGFRNRAVTISAKISRYHGMAFGK